MQQLIDKAVIYVENLFFDKLPEKMYFHDIAHTRQTLKVAREIGIHSCLSRREMFVLELAALFHDTGYTHTYTGHEEKSAQIATDFLRNESVEKEIIDEICRCIAETRFPQCPTKKLGKILCDADLYHFSLEDYVLYSEKLRTEWEVMLNLFFETPQWNSLNLKLLISHEYFEPYSRSAFQQGKQLNIERLQMIDLF
ncbi:MAG: HD domain-containing protein [Chryseobacterium sp.]|nr:MAG: HD domain-containing protein [Chryseobacterium sp.]